MNVGRYQLRSVLGEGGMGTVHLAHDPVLDRPIALKLLRNDALGSQGARARMIREARVMAKLSHPNIVTIFEAGEDAGTIYIAMEVVTGGTLSRWLDAENRTTAEVLHAFVAAGRGLAAAHAAGIVHRDFKPSNVLVGLDGRVLVTDFGIASSAEGDESWGNAPTPRVGHPSLTHTGAVMGTPRYMSPEQYAGRKTDARTDQFSFAVALYEAVFGVSPFDGDGFEARRDAVLGGRLRQLDPIQLTRAPEPIRSVLFRALANDPAQRFPSMLDLLRALEPPPRAKVPAVQIVAGIAMWALLAVAVVLPSIMLRFGDDPRLAALDDQATVRARCARGGWWVFNVFESAGPYGTSLTLYNMRNDETGVAGYIYVFRTGSAPGGFVESTSATCRARNDAVIASGQHVVCAGSGQSPAVATALLALVLPGQ